MKHASQQRTAGVGKVVGALVFGSVLWLSCQPGELPCDSPEWQMVCTQPASATGSGTPPATGGAGGGAPPAAAISATTPIANCGQWPTLGDMDKFFAMRCGVNATCHGTGAVWTDMQKAGMWKTVTTDLTANAKVSCAGQKLANPTNWRESVLWLKTQSPASCPGGAANAGLTMPPQMTYEPKLPVLNQTEIACLEGFLKAVTGK
jgi:hypothetical protein